LQGKIGEPTTATLQKLADYFGVSVAYLRGEDPETPKGKPPLPFIKHLREAVKDRGVDAIAETTGISAAVIKLYMIGIGYPSDESFEGLAQALEISQNKLKIRGIADSFDFYVLEKLLIFFDSHIRLILEGELFAVDKSRVGLLLGFAKIVTDLPVGYYLHQNVINNDEYLEMNERALLFIEKFQMASGSQKNLIEPSVVITADGIQDNGKKKF
jgi:transcriptional regulator with XRE-family HTH domain